MGYWREIGSTKRHRRFYPADDKPGIILFVVIGLAGLVCLGVFLWKHFHGTAGVPEVRLGWIGAGLVLVAGWQVRVLGKGD